MALKAEEKLSRKQGQRGRGRSQPRGKAVAQKEKNSKEDWKRPQAKLKEVEPHSRGRQYAEPMRQHTEPGGGYADAKCNSSYPR
jgi:hypothetical protein